MPDGLRFIHGEHFEAVFATEAGWVAVSAAVEVVRTTLVLTNISVEPLETKVLKVGVSRMLGILEDLGSEARQEGYTHLEIVGKRISGANPFRPLRLRRRL